MDDVLICLISFIFKAEVEDALKRIQEHKGVQGCVIINNDGEIAVFRLI